MTIRTHTSVLLALLLCANIYAADFNSPAQLYLKNGSSLAFTVRTIHSWGLYNDRGEFAHYRVIDSLFTADSAVAFSIADMNKLIMIAQTSKGYVLSFAKYVSTLHYRPPVEPLTPYSLTLLYRYDVSSGLAFHYDGTVFNSEHLFHRFQGMMSFQPHQEIYATLGFALGIGYHAEVGSTRLAVVASYGIFGGQTAMERPSGLSTVIMLSPGISYEIENTMKVHLAVGGDVFLRRARSDLPPRPVLVFVGIGARL